MTGHLGGIGTGIGGMAVRAGGGGIAIVTGATIGDGATAVMIVAEAITAGATMEMIAVNIAGDGADATKARRPTRPRADGREVVSLRKA